MQRLDLDFQLALGEVGALGCQRHDNPAAVGRMRSAFQEAACFESIKSSRHPRRGLAGEAGQLSRSLALAASEKSQCGDHSRHTWADPNCLWFATTAPINHPTCPGEDGLDRNEGNNPICNRTNAWNVSMGFKSKHPGGAQFVMCDGSVQFLSETIDYDLYQRLGDRRDGNPVAITQ